MPYHPGMIGNGSAMMVCEHSTPCPICLGHGVGYTRTVGKMIRLTQVYVTYNKIELHILAMNSYIIWHIDSINNDTILSGPIRSGSIRKDKLILPANVDQLAYTLWKKLTGKIGPELVAEWNGLHPLTDNPITYSSNFYEYSKVLVILRQLVRDNR